MPLRPTWQHWCRWPAGTGAGPWTGAHSTQRSRTTRTQHKCHRNQGQGGAQQRRTQHDADLLLLQQDRRGEGALATCSQQTVNCEPERERERETTLTCVLCCCCVAMSIHTQHGLLREWVVPRGCCLGSRSQAAQEAGATADSGRAADTAGGFLLGRVLVMGDGVCQ